MAGYSTTPLAKKLGIKAGFRVYVDNGPENYLQLLAPLPDNVVFARKLDGKINLIHLFAREAERIAGKLAVYIDRIVENGAIWVSWPKKAPGFPPM